MPVVSHSANLNVHSTAGCTIERFVRRAAMEIDRRAEHGDLNQDGGDDEGEDETKKARHYPPASETVTDARKTVRAELNL